MLDWISSLIASHGYLALFLAALVEGPIAAVIGAFLASQGLLDIRNVYLIAVSADLVGDLLLYGLGRSGRLPRSMTGDRGSPPNQLVFSALLDRFRAQPGRVLVSAKLTHAAGLLVLLAAGVARIPLKKFLWFNFIATLPKAAIFVVLGYFAGAAYTRIDHYIWVFSCGVLGVLGVLFVIYLRRICNPIPPEG